MSAFARSAILFCLLAGTATAQAQTSLPALSGELASSFTTADTLFKTPYIDQDEWRDQPVRHRYVHGGFKGTDTKFSFYFPTKEGYQGRFFHYLTPFPDRETVSQGATGEEDKIGFSINSGAYFVETNGGGAIDFSKPMPNKDPSIAAYRANAASAQFSRVVATKLYGGKRPYGYCFGGSGGAYRTVGGMENTVGVWEGAVAYVLGSPMALPNVFTVRMHAMRVLHDKLPRIIDALEPGGSGDMYAGLNAEEKAALQEVTKMGFPAQSWFGYKTMGIHGFLVLYQTVVRIDPKYFQEDFWHKPGYLGATPPASLLRARLQQTSKIKAPLGIDQAVTLHLAEPLSARDRGTAEAAWKSLGGAQGSAPVGFELENSMSNVNFLGGDLVIKTGAAAGKTLQLTKVAGQYVALGPTDPTVLALIKPGDEVQVDNSNFLAVQTYHRHQVPGPEYHVWDQFRGPDGKPLYPQRPLLLGPLLSKGAAGSVATGKFKGKMIVLESMMDREAFPWQADWYHARVKESLGAATDDNFRLWYTDHALHGDQTVQEDGTHTVSYLGVLQQALRDLSTWVEKGIAPAATTNYKIVDGQVVVPPTAAARRGIQPVVKLTVGGQARTEVKAGQPVAFTGLVEVPAGMGQVVAAAWDFDGSGKFAEAGKLAPAPKGSSPVVVKATHAFAKPGTYFATLRAVSQRQGDAKTPYARIQNLARVRVVVK